MVHHTMEKNMDHEVYISMSKPIRKTHALLTNDATMAEEIDRVISECVISKLPVYIFVPTDVVDLPLDATRLGTPLNTTIINKDKSVEAAAIKKILELIKKASSPIILVDVLAIRHGGKELSRKFVELTQFRTYSTAASKGVIDEQSSTYGGVYNGKSLAPLQLCWNVEADLISVSFPGVADAVHSSDLVINIGPLLSDSTTGGFSRQINDEHLISLGHDDCQVQAEIFKGLHFLPVLQGVTDALEKQPNLYDLPRPQDWKLIEVSDI